MTQTYSQNYNKPKNNLSILTLTQMNFHFDEYLELINSGKKDLVEALIELTQMEMAVRESNTRTAFIRTANFPFQKRFDDFDFSFQPTLNKSEIISYSDMRFLENKENILFVGSPGVGKTHLAVSIGIEAAMNRKLTYFIHCNELIMQLKKAMQENRLESRLKFFAKYKLLIIDEVGFLPLDSESSKLFFQLISMRYEKSSTIITTNKPLNQWTDVFGDPVLANAILDRLLHHCHLINIVGKSYRTKDLINELAE